MKMKVLFVLLFVIEQISAQTNKGIKAGGTLIIAGICENGTHILIATESRTSMSRDGKGIVAYYESSRKVIVSKNIAFGAAGITSFGSFYFAGLLDLFTHFDSNKITLENIFPSFRDFYKPRLDKVLNEQINLNSYVVCGFVSSIPKLYLYQPSKNVIWQKKGVISSATQSGLEKSTALADIVYKQTVGQTKEMFDYIIQQEIKMENTGKIANIGGKTHFIDITKDKVIESGTIPKYNFKNDYDLYQAIRQNKIAFWYKSKADSVYINNLIKKGSALYQKALEK